MTVEEIREALAADEMSGIARWHMVKTLLAEVDSLRARLAVAEKDRDAAIDREHETTERLLKAEQANAALLEALTTIADGIDEDDSGLTLRTVQKYARAALHPATKEGKA